MDLADLVVDAGVEEDPLGRGGLARVDVSHDPDVADLGQGGGGFGGHGVSLSISLVSEVWVALLRVTERFGYQR